MNKNKYLPEQMNAIYSFLEQLQEMSVVQQMKRTQQEEFENAKKSNVRPPVYSMTVEAASQAAQHPFRGNITGSDNPLAVRARKIEQKRMERLGVFSPLRNDRNDRWQEELRGIQGRNNK